MVIALSKTDPPTTSPAGSPSSRNNKNNNDHQERNNGLKLTTISRAAFWFCLGALISRNLSLSNASFYYSTTLEYYAPFAPEVATTTESFLFALFAYADPSQSCGGKATTTKGEPVRQQKHKERHY